MKEECTAEVGEVEKYNGALFNEKKQYLSIIYNNFQTNKTFEELIGNNLFTTARVVTYVSSSLAFILEKFNSYDRLELIVGEEDTAMRTFESIEKVLKNDIEKELSLFPEILNKILSGGIKIRYPKMNEVVHSKIYVLKGQTTRIMIGSANLTKTAITGKQYEELIVYDSNYNEDICNEVEKRFQYLWDNTVDVITPTFKKTIKDTIINSNVVIAKNINNSNVLTNSLSAEHVNNSKVFILDPEIQSKIIQEKLTKQAELGVNWSQVLTENRDGKEKIYGIMEKVEETHNILEKITAKKDNNIVLKTANKIKEILKEESTKKIRIKATILSNQSEEYEDLRNLLVYDKTSKNILINKDFKEESEKKLLESYPLEIDIEKLNFSLTRVEKFIKSYSKFTASKDKSLEKKIFEAILYTFTSPVVWLMREDVYHNMSKEKVAEIPPFLIIGGTAGTGKTKLLMFMNQLLGNKYPILDYKKIDNRGKTYLESLIRTENIFPIIVDEVSQNLFAGNGEALIKNVANTIIEPHPCLIGATNQEFTSEAQVIRRVYYIDLPHAILPESKKEAERYFKEEVEIDKIKDDLFKMYLHEYVNVINSDKKFYKIEDPLWLGREIFKEFYRKIGVEVPRFVNEEPIGDYYKIGSEKWRGFYEMHKSDQRIVRIDKINGDEVVFVDLLAVYRERYKTGELEKRVPPYVIKSRGNPLILYKDKFFEFIDLKSTNLNRWFKFGRWA